MLFPNSEYCWILVVNKNSSGIVIMMYGGRESSEHFLMPENTHQKEIQSTME